MKNKYHQEILKLIQRHSGKATQHTFLDSYLGNTHPRYPISAPVLRPIAKEWMREHRDMPATVFANLLTSLIEGISSTEKCMAGILLGYATADQQKFAPKLFDHWLDHLVGWAEVDAVCTGKYTIQEIPANWEAWRPLLKKFSKSKNIQKRRASLVLLCSPLVKVKDEQLAMAALQHVDTLKNEKEILITRAISWVLRSMQKNFRELLIEYLDEHEEKLPKIAVRETRMKLKTGRKSKIRKLED